MRKIPVVRQIAWQSVLCQIILVATFIVIASYLGGSTRLARMTGVIIYGLYQVVIKIIIERPINRGLKLIQARKFEEAIPQCEDAYQFYSVHQWIDKWRFFLLISSSVSFREMALVNIAFCYSQIGNGKKSKEYYQQVLAEFPESSFAEIALKSIKAFETNKK